MMALRVCVTAFALAAFLVGAVAVPLYSVPTGIAGGTFISHVNDALSGVLTPSYTTQRSCIISPSSNAFPFTTTPTQSVQAGYLGVVGSTTLCCAFIGNIDTTVASANYGNCMHNVCSFGTFDDLAYDGYLGSPLGTLTSTSAGPSFFFSSTSNGFSHLCLPQTACYEQGTMDIRPARHNITGTVGSNQDNFYNYKGSAASVPVAVSPYRTNWVYFPTAYTPVTNALPAYTIPAGTYSAYDVYTSKTIFCDTTLPSPNCLVGPASRASHFACKDRGAFDGTFCDLPCGLSVDIYIKDVDASAGGNTNDASVGHGHCYANCVAIS